MILKTFGRIAEIIPTETKIAIELKTVEALKSYLEDTYPEIRGITYLLVVNKVIANAATILNSNDEIALLPPFSGG